MKALMAQARSTSQSSLMSTALQMIVSWTLHGFQRCPRLHLPGWPQTMTAFKLLLLTPALCWPLGQCFVPLVPKVGLQQPCTFMVVAWVSKVLGG